MPTSAPTTPYLRRGEVIAWLESLGIDDKIFLKLVDAKTIQRVTLAGGGRGYYLKAEIEQHILKPFKDAEARLAK